MTREYTRRLLDLLNDGTLTHEMVLNEILKYESEDWVREFCIEGFAGELQDLFEGMGAD